MELFWDVLGETLVDTAKMLPFLFLAYLFIEYVEHRHGERIEAVLERSGRWGAIPGAVLGCVPQCGFSAIASNFYASRVISLGTLMAVFLATSDEAVPLLVSMPAYWDKLALLMAIKVVYAIVVGLIPNCAASVLLTQLYVEGALRFSSLVAGLCTGAGVGLAVLWRANPSWKQNLFITGLTWAAGAAVGVGIQIVVALAG